MKLGFKRFSLIEVMVSLIILAILLTIVTNTSVGTAFFLKSINESNKNLNKPEIDLAVFQADISHSMGSVNAEFIDGSGTVSFTRLLIDAQFLTPRAVMMEYDFGKTGIKRKLFFWALDLGEEYDVRGKSGWYNFKLKIARKLIFSKWQEALGGNVEAIACGSAALQPRLARVFFAAGIPVMEGYGLTETSPVCSVNMQKDNKIKFGTTGTVIDGVTVKIAESDGEILVKGPNVMMGYYKDEAKTNEVIKN